MMQVSAACDAAPCSLQDAPVRVEPCSLEEVGPSGKWLIHEDDDYVVIDKPRDVRMDGDHAVTVEKILRAHLGAESVLKWVHQLDYATSGLLCVARSRPAARAVADLFQAGAVEKRYLAVVHGWIDWDGLPVIAKDDDDDYDENRQQQQQQQQGLKAALEATSTDAKALSEAKVHPAPRSSSSATPEDGASSPSIDLQP